MESIDGLETIQHQWRYKNTVFSISLLYSEEWIAEWKPLIGGDWQVIGGALGSIDEAKSVLLQHIQKRIEEGTL